MLINTVHQACTWHVTSKIALRILALCHHFIASHLNDIYNGVLNLFPSQHKLHTMIDLSEVSNCKLCESGIIISKLCYRQVMMVKMCYPKLKKLSLKLCKMGQEQQVPKIS